jgi:LytS/YehU family sensor histidine kinase
VPLKEEMQTVEDYLALEALRYEARLRFNIAIDPASMDIHVPTMMVQTLVENAIKHGISKSVEGGEIEIRTKISDDSLVLEIDNSGTLQGSPFKQDGGFGIANTQLRLQLLFADRAKFDIFQAGTGRVVAQVIMPALKTESSPKSLEQTAA